MEEAQGAAPEAVHPPAEATGEADPSAEGEQQGDSGPLAGEGFIYEQMILSYQLAYKRIAALPNVLGSGTTMAKIDVDNGLYRVTWHTRFYWKGPQARPSLHPTRASALPRLR